MDKDFKVIGNCIRNIREVKNLSREKLAEKAEISTSYVYKIEAGNAHASIDILRKVADALGISLTNLLAEHSLENHKKEELDLLINGLSDNEMDFICYMVKHYIYAKELFLNH